MPSIQTAITLYDGVSAPLSRIRGAVSETVSAFADLDAAAGRCGTELSVQSMETAIRGAENAQNDLNRAFQGGESAANGLLRKVKSAAAALLSLKGAQKALELSDELQTVEARFKLVKGGDEAGFEEMVMASAQRSRASYLDTAQAVANIGTNGGSAFDSGAEIVAFTEQLNKLFALSGANAQSCSAAMLQITQAMGEGFLRGEELRSVLENAPAVARAIEDYMGIAEGSIQKYAEEGKVTAEVVKNALLSGASETNEAFESLPLTWEQLGERIKNQAISLFAPVLEQLGELASSGWVEDFTTGLAEGLAFLARSASVLLNAISNIGTVISENWGIISPILSGAVGVIALIQGALAAGKATEALNKTKTALSTLYKTPFMGFLTGFIIIMAAIYAIVGAINKVRGTAISATGLICGAVAVAGAILRNIAVGVLNGIIQLLWCFISPFTTIIEWILNVCNGGFDSLGGAVANLIGNIIGWFLSLGQVVTKIIDTIFGLNWTDGLEKLKKDVTSWGETEQTVKLGLDTPDGLEQIAYDDAWDAGYGFGENLEDKVKGLFDLNSMDSLDAFGVGNTFDDLYAAAEETAANTAVCADNLNLAEEDIKYLRDIAEREAINRFTTAEIRVEQYNENRIEKDTDLDGLMDQWTAQFAERLAVSAEGVLAS